MPFHDKRSKRKYEEVLVNSILYLNYLTKKKQVKNCSLVAVTKL